MGSTTCRARSAARQPFPSITSRRANIFGTIGRADLPPCLLFGLADFPSVLQSTTDSFSCHSRSLATTTAWLGTPAVGASLRRPAAGVKPGVRRRGGFEPLGFDYEATASRGKVFAGQCGWLDPLASPGRSS